MSLLLPIANKKQSEVEKMTKVYIKQNGTKVVVEVSEQMANDMKELRRAEWRQEAKAKYYCKSINEDYLVAPNGSAEDQHILEETKKEEQALLIKALKTLSESQKEIVQKRFVKGMELQEIADEYGITKQAVFNRLQKILKKLKKVFTEGVD